MTTDAAIFVPNGVTLEELGAMFLKVFPQGKTVNADADSMQFLESPNETGYLEICDRTRTGGTCKLPDIWDQTNEPPDGYYYAKSGFFDHLGPLAKQITLWGNPREFIRTVLIQFAQDERIWMMMYNGKITHGHELQGMLLSKAFFQMELPWCTTNDSDET